MAEKHKKKLGIGWILLLIFLPLLDFVLVLRYLLQGKNIAVLTPHGAIAEAQHNLLIFVTLVLLAIGIPTLVVLYFVAWKYRESGPHAIANPVSKHGKLFVASMWIIPTIFALIIGLVLVPATHDLIPQKTIAADAKPMTIQVISLRWKWLFLYPEQGIATVNFVQIPVNTPVSFELTADEAPMSSFWIPNLGGQLYSMTSHVNKLNLIGETVGDFPGSTPEINGAGFTGMKFTTRVSTQETFDKWVGEVKQSPDVLDIAAYEKLVEPSKNNPVVYYAAYDKNLYDMVIAKYNDASGGHNHSEESTEEGHAGH